jgi:hypothetical protein
MNSVSHVGAKREIPEMKEEEGRVARLLLCFLHGAVGFKFKV